MERDLDDTRLRATLGYPKFSATPTVLIFDTQYLVVGDVVEAAVDLGWNVHRLPTRKKGSGDNQFIAALLTALVTVKPDFILTINHLGFDEGGILASLLEGYGIPMASWFVDHPMPILGGAQQNATSNLQVFCFERSAFDWLGRNGYESPVFLPTGSNKRYFNPEAIDKAIRKKYTHPLAFAGSSWWYKTRVEPAKQVRKAARALASNQVINRTTVAGAFEKMLEKGDRKAFGAAQVALAEASMRTRQQFVNRLSDLNLKLFGDQYWRNICPKVKVTPYLDYKTELPALFAACHINVNITAEQMPTAVNQRVWDVPGAGGFLLTDAQEDALDVFQDGDSMVFYTSLDEAVSKAQFYREKADLRQKIAKRGWEIVEKSHRITHRLDTMYTVMKKRFG